MPVNLPYTLRPRGYDRYVPAVAMFLLSAVPILIFFIELDRPNDDPGAFGTAGMVALVVAAVPLIATAVWFARRVARMSVTVESDRLIVNNMFRSRTIPLSDVLWFEERLTSPGRTPPVVEVCAQYGERSLRLEAASVTPDLADEFQAELIEVLERLAPKHGYRMHLINAPED